MEVGGISCTKQRGKMLAVMTAPNQKGKKCEGRVKTLVTGRLNSPLAARSPGGKYLWKTAARQPTGGGGGVIFCKGTSDAARPGGRYLWKTAARQPTGGGGESFFASGLVMQPARVGGIFGKLQPGSPGARG
jgi:hypothetical protein